MQSQAKFLLALVPVIVSLGLAACAGLQPAPTPSITFDDLIGIWKLDDYPSYLQFNEDGTYQSGYEPGSDSYASGQFQLDGALLTFIPDADRSCTKPGSYLVERTEQGQLFFELQEDECPIRADISPGFLDPVEP